MELAIILSVVMVPTHNLEWHFAHRLTGQVLKLFGAYIITLFLWLAKTDVSCGNRVITCQVNRIILIQLKLHVLMVLLQF